MSAIICQFFDKAACSQRSVPAISRRGPQLQALTMNWQKRRSLSLFGMSNLAYLSNFFLRLSVICLASGFVVIPKSQPKKFTIPDFQKEVGMSALAFIGIYFKMHFFVQSNRFVDSLIIQQRESILFTPALSAFSQQIHVQHLKRLFQRRI
ncbi:Hypothetical_protein [Hexamita inflata]|uniref:Hypothetical_protein n=1 Tax=Hexamita inflata TaxID=28002 RepID=A0AA86RBV1_9EUKA|nr:Hypothetical protein HINF_LOCUS30809 [Hexamita inflata]CAI9971106.1 Hypothetical protein HINF_LOCUS58751 [Hexamita inflata]